MWRMATIFRPLRSKRATISPVRPRAKASGLTRMRVRSTELLSFRIGAFALRSSVRRPAAVHPCDPAVGTADRRATLLCRRFGRHGRLIRGLAATAPTCRGRRAGARLGLAVGAQLPGRVDRLPAAEAGVLELAHAARAAQVVGLDLVVAVR